VSVGCGVRVLSGERTRFAYPAALRAERLLKAARTAALIASGPQTTRVAGFHQTRTPQLYPVAGSSEAEISAKLELIARADRAARAFDPRIVQVRAGLNDELRRILVAASDGTFASDTQPLARLNVAVIAKDEHNSARGSSGGGGRVTLDFFTGSKSPEHFATEAAGTAGLQLGAVGAPAGDQGG